VPEQEYSPNVEEYLEELYRLTETYDPHVSTGDLAKRLGIKAPSVTEMLRSLEDKGLVDYEPYKGAILTDKGVEEGRKLLEKHRLVERLLVDELGLDWSEVHHEACELEHAISDELEEKIREALEEPETCPHGKPVSGRANDEALESLKPGNRAMISSVSDDDPEVLRRLEELEILPGTEFELVKKTHSGDVVLKIHGQEAVLGPEKSDAVRVKPLEA